MSDKHNSNNHQLPEGMSVALTTEVEEREMEAVNVVATAILATLTSTTVAVEVVTTEEIVDVWR